MTVKNIRTENRELILGRFIYYEFGSYGGGDAGSVTGPRSKVAMLLLFSDPGILSTLYRWPARCSLGHPGYPIANLWLCDTGEIELPKIMTRKRRGF